MSLMGFPNKLIKSVVEKGAVATQRTKVITATRNTTRVNKGAIFREYSAITIQPAVGLLYQTGTSHQTPRGTDCAC